MTTSHIFSLTKCVRPLLEHCMFILRGVWIKDKLRLVPVHRRLTFHILGIDCTLNYNTLGIDPLWKRKLKPDLIFFFRILNKLSFTFNEAIHYVETLSCNIRNFLFTSETISF